MTAIRLSAAIMAHPARAVMVDDLLGRLDQPVPVVWDQIQDRHDTGIRAMEAFDPAATHHLVLQDDVLPCRDLLAGVERALAHVPADCPASFYVGKVKPFRRAVQRAVDAAGDDASWIVMDGIYWGPAIAVPTELIPNMAAWYRGPLGEAVTNYDRRVSTWFSLHAGRCWYSWPSLVDHHGDESIARAGRTAIRRAHRFHPGSALDLDWSGPVVDMGRTARLDRQRQHLATAAGG